MLPRRRRPNQPNDVRAPPSRMALKVGEYIDKTWEVVPDNDTATVRLQFRLEERPFAGKISMMSEFVFRAIDEENERFYNVGLNPNLNGRWLIENVTPGTYKVHVIGNGRFAGWTWEREALSIEPNTAELYELDLVPAANP